MKHAPNIHAKLTTCAWTSCHFTQMENIWFPQLMTALTAAWTSHMGICNLPLNWRQMPQEPGWQLLKEKPAMDHFFRLADKLVWRNVPLNGRLYSDLHGRQQEPKFLSLSKTNWHLRGTDAGKHAVLVQLNRKCHQRGLKTHRQMCTLNQHLWFDML